ncbi:MAG: hypothetical protein RRA94_04040 [Bacteroidota bacterium]|nr:hypothetical protein [Bacteroidota bacterium]
MRRNSAFFRRMAALVIIGAVIGVLGCNDQSGGPGRSDPGRSAPGHPTAGGTRLQPPSGTTVRTASLDFDSIRAEIYAELRQEFPSGPVVRIRLDSVFIPVTDSILVDSLEAELEETRRIARDAIGIVRRMQAQLRAMPGSADVLAVLDTATCFDEAESCFSVRAEYSHRDAAYKNVKLRHEWIERSSTFWDAVIEYAPYAGAILALVKISFDTFSK